MSTEYFTAREDLTGVHSVRRNALEKLAALSATTPNDKAGRSDIFKLCRKCPQGRPTVNGYGFKSQSTRYAASSVPMVGQAPCYLRRAALIY